MVARRGSSGTALAVERFAGWEPLGFEAGDNNWYRFVANGPTGKTDPSGLGFPVPKIPGPGETPGPGWLPDPINPGSWIKPGPPRENLHNDMKHGPGKDPHWGWKDPKGNEWEFFPDTGKWHPKYKTIKPGAGPDFPKGMLEPTPRPRPKSKPKPELPPEGTTCDPGDAVYFVGTCCVFAAAGALAASDLALPIGDYAAAGLLCWWFIPSDPEQGTQETLD